MIRLIQGFLTVGLLLHSLNGFTQDTNTVELHIQVYDKGVCTPLIPSIYYSTSKYQRTKSVFQGGSYYSTIYVGVNSTDSAHLLPQNNHQLLSSSLRFNPKLDYELVILHYDGFNRNSPDSTVIKISKLDKNAQLIIPLKKGKYDLKKMKYFKELKSNLAPDFRSVERKEFKNTLKLDSVARYTNGEKKAKYYIIADNFPLYFVQEFDSIHPSDYAQGYHLKNHNGGIAYPGTPIWSNAASSKYGYWEYFENDKIVKHELWASMLQEKYEWYPSGQLKYATQYGHSNKENGHVFYLENGNIKEEFRMQTTTQSSYLKTYAYSSKGKIAILTTYNSINGLTKQDLQKRELFYPSGQLKMEENYVGAYTIKYYNEDGTERIK
jgi:antitoxin component YwqK of YwqJK toxin-antitoxin module